MINHANWAPQGALTIETALKTLAEGEQAIAKSEETCTIDLSKIESIDSAGVAVLLEWQRFANQQNKKIYLSHPSRHLMAMLKLSSLENILSIKPVI